MSDTQELRIEGPGLTQSVVDELPVSLEAVLGVTTLKIGELRRLADGDSLALDTLLGDPVELRLNGVTIACGELVAVAEKFGIRITALTTR